MNIDDFLTPRLVGKRFESHSIPLELLGDLAVLEAMIKEAAKWLYMREHSGRERAPRKFADGLSLTLTAVEEGSAVAKITLVATSAGFFPPAEATYLEQARDAVVASIAAASENESPSEHLPPKILAYFDRMGRSLRNDEAIEFPSPLAGRPARLTKPVRLRLLKAAEATERTEEIRVRGAVHDLNQETMKFEMRLSDGSKVSGPVDRQQFDYFMEAFNEYKNGIKVLLQGVGKYNRADRLQAVESVEQVTVLDPLDFQSQIDDLRTLKDGWYDGLGIAPSPEGLNWLCAEFGERYSDTLPSPYVYPVVEGGVRLEWPIGRWDVSLEIDLRERIGEWHALHLDTDEEESKRLVLGSRADWDWMTGRIQALSGVDS